MDLVSSCQEKLASFRLKELKDVLTQIGVSKQGKKQDLVERVLALLSDEAPNVRVSAKKKFIGKEAVAGIIDDAYRKLQAGGATSASTNGESFLGINNVKLKEEVANPVHLDKKICCPCGSSLPTEYMIQCADQRCLVFQHISCVIIEEEYSEGIPPFPSRFYCEICRINRADPFWVTVGHLLSPVKLITANNPADGTTPLQIVEKTFQLTRTDIDLLQNMEYDVQAWCILLNDTVPFRMQWPLYADLKVNGVPVRTVNRPGSQLLGANGRDDGPMIAFYIGEEVNQISLSGCDARSFCLGVRLVNRRTIQQILNVIFEDQNCEPFEDALVRVRCCIGGGMAMANEDSDSDLEVIADSVTVNLRCPMSGSRIKTAGRFRPCAHMGCFDLETFVQLNQRSRKWQCPICLKNYSLEDITVDPYFNLITKMVQDCGDDVTEIEVKPDGSWRLKIGYQFKNLEQWHLPNGSIGVSGSEVDVSLKASTHLEEEGTVGQSNPKQVTKPRDKQTANQLGEYFENDRQNIITMSSSSSESRRDDGDCSVNEDGIEHSDTSANNGNNSNPVSYNMDTTDRNMNRNTDASLGDLDVIVLSDSEEENANLTSPGTISISQAVNYSGHSFPASPAPFNAYIEDPALDAGVRSSLGNFRSNGNDLEMSHQAFCSGTRSNNASEALIDPEYTAVTSSATTDVYALTSKCSTDPCGQVFGSSVCQSNTGTNDSLVSNPLAFVCVDPPVQTIPGTRQPGLTMQSDPGSNPQTSNGVCGKNLTSFGLGSNDIGGNGAAGIHAEPATSTGMDLVNQFESTKALLPRSMDDEIRSNGKTEVKVSSGPFSFPRQPRSVRRRYLP